MSRQMKLLSAWVVAGGIAILIVTRGPGGEVVAGLILFAWGSVIGLNYKDAANSMPPRLLFTEWSPARWRTAFLFFGLIGTILLAGGVYSLVTLLGRTAAAQASRGVRQCSGMTPEGLGY